MENNVFVIRGSKVLLDIVLLMLVGFPILFLFLWGVPFQRGFFCNDEDLIHPYHESTVPSIYLYIIGILMNVIVMMIIEFFNQPSDNKQIMFLGHIIPNWTYNVYCVVLIFAFGMACSQLTTDVMKYSIGRLRPHFLTVCSPNINCSISSNQHKYITQFECTNKEFINNKRIIKELRLSFPSGHSSFSMFTMLYFAIYLQKRMTWNGSKLLKHTLQFIAVLSALFTAMTRVSDYKHHWSDVLSGLFIGTIVACVTAIYFSNLFEWNYSKSGNEEKETELQVLNGSNTQVI